MSLRTNLTCYMPLVAVAFFQPVLAAEYTPRSTVFGQTDIEAQGTSLRAKRISGRLNPLICNFFSKSALVNLGWYYNN